MRNTCLDTQTTSDTELGSLANERVEIHTCYKKFTENGLLPIAEAQSDLLTFREMTCDFFFLAKREVKTCLYLKSNENTNLMQNCAGFISAGSLYMFRAQAPIIRSI